MMIDVVVSHRRRRCGRGRGNEREAKISFSRVELLVVFGDATGSQVSQCRTYRNKYYVRDVRQTPFVVGHMMFATISHAHPMVCRCVPADLGVKTLALGLRRLLNCSRQIH